MHLLVLGPYTSSGMVGGQPATLHVSQKKVAAASVWQKIQEEVQNICRFKPNLFSFFFLFSEIFKPYLIKLDCSVHLIYSDMYYSDIVCLYSISPSPGSDVAHICKMQFLIMCQVKSSTHKNKECVHALISCVCLLTSLPGDDETEYNLYFL